MREPIIDEMMAFIGLGSYHLDAEELAGFVWERDFYDIESDDNIAWGDVDSITQASFHRTTKFGGGFDTKYPVSQGVKDIISKYKQGCDLVARLPSTQRNGHSLSVTCRGLRRAEALKRLTQKQRASKRIRPWFPQDPEVDAIFSAWETKIPVQANKRIPDQSWKADSDTLDKSRIMWVKPAHLEEAYRREKSTSKEDWPDDEPQKIIYGHRHGLYIIADGRYDPVTDETEESTEDSDSED
ncbi:uncharacterized protein FTJAE_264 [Fusarium tjaetaba]|uniref:Uncharacterized protein n=1 Tax=Fusarium tjaetaba TaxID=1567544 RepID=A0A8H5SG14_9HYPO|nr:uncharacterized protein FTJAE_264 [Fusarium tjaetaba]KAF5651087.1 hypothetical protein FTJAE_264 [Fusarium tjaetaba]